MRNIQEFFKRIGGVQAKEVAKREVIRLAIKEYTQIDVPIASITVRSGIAVIKGISHAARSGIFIHKQYIINRITFLDASLHIVDLR